MKIKVLLLIGLVTLVISVVLFQTFPTTSTKYYKTGEVKSEFEFVGGNPVKRTGYYPAGEV